jgi:hypothetical protein
VPWDAHFKLTNLLINSQLEEGPFCSQFALQGYANEETTIIPVFSFCEESVEQIRIRLYDYIIKEIKRAAKQNDVALVYSTLVNYKRIDLMRIVNHKNQTLFEYTRDCDTSRPLYEPLYVYKYNRVGDVEIMVFTGLMCKAFLMAKENTICL